MLYMKKICIGSSPGLLSEGLALLCRNTGIFTVCSIGDTRNPNQDHRDFPCDILIIDPATFHHTPRDLRTTAAGNLVEEGSLHSDHTIASLRKWYGSAAILAIVDSQDMRALYPFQNQGYDGFIFRDRPFSEALLVIEAVYQGAVYIPTEVAESLPGFSAEGDIHLTSREIEILKQVAIGSTSKQIASLFHIAVSTVETHRKNLFRKLSVSSMAELIRYAIKSGITPL
jgi:DNA-binding NarL/FixJ family response regulator